ncbi:MAG: hypothetical protein BWX66_01430 [Deltaproteobacteria bacterium ADurb.Bin058]|nr:MAG: hypothetical protein BWX66_01430 [Deltaproteobacteria bacterium ADurb.Bin058]
MLLRSSIAKRIDLPCLVNNKMCSPSLASRTEIRSSSGSSLIALRPEARIFLNSTTSVRLTTPFLVANTKDGPGLKSSTARMALTLSSPARLSRLTMARPFEVREPSGISYTRRLNARPLSVKKITHVWVDATNMSVTKSSSLVCIPALPLPPRLWLLKTADAVRLMKPCAETVTTMSSSGIRSSRSISPRSSVSSLRRLSP